MFRSSFIIANRVIGGAMHGEFGIVASRLHKGHAERLALEAKGEAAISASVAPSRRQPTVPAPQGKIFETKSSPVPERGTV
eukprot:6207134-Pleurochrysis_carterae.AAC.2